MRPTTPRLSRRAFLHVSAAAAAAPGLLRGSRRPPPTTLRVACIGVGGQGRADLGAVSAVPGVRIAALCDVDAHRLAPAAAAHPGAATFRDFRRLFDAMHRELDAVVVATPDHMHGPIAIAALQRGKHVYCQKPLAHNVRECRQLAALAAEHGVATQMGTQIHAHGAYRTAVAALRAGVLGRVQEAHLWVSKSWAGPAGGRPQRVDPVPPELDWDLWLGVAAARPYVAETYHPARWRGWTDFGGGTLGDMGCHIFDPVFAGLGLGSPRAVVSHGPAHHDETFAADGDVRYRFAGTPRTVETIPLRWTDGNAESRPDASRAQLPAGASLPGAGSFLVGERGVMVLPHWSMPRFYADGEVLDLEIERLSDADHHAEWVAACRGNGATSCPFASSAPLTEAVLLGGIAGRFPGAELEWDPDRTSFGDAAADAFVGRSYREGWRP